ncbi:MAG: DUF1800 domain-containing protein [bacterium]
MSRFATHVIGRMGFGARNGSGGGVRSVTNILDRDGLSEWSPSEGSVSMTPIGNGEFRVVFGGDGHGIQTVVLNVAANDLVRPRIDIRRESGGTDVEIFDVGNIGPERVHLTLTNSWQTYTWGIVKNVGGTGQVRIKIAKLSGGATQIVVRAANLHVLTDQAQPQLGENVPQGTSFFEYENGTIVNPDFTVTDAVGQPITGELEEFMNLGATDQQRLQAYLDQQLNWSALDDSELDARNASGGYITLDETLQQMWLEHRINGNNRDAPAEEMERVVINRAVYSKRQLLEVLADFWHNHFNVQSRDTYAQSVFTSWDRDVVRPPVSGHPREGGFENGHMLGNFRQMLELSSRHAAMQHYLDNFINAQGSPNENYAREIMELHTLGAENYVSLGDPNSINKTDIPLPWGAGGSDIMVSIADQYVDDDVYSAMRMMTGWKLKDNAGRIESNFEDTGEHYYYSGWHDKGLKRIMGHFWNDFAPDPQDIGEFLDIISYHPGTAHHIAGKLCRRFINENPSESLVSSIATVWYDNRYAANQLELVYRALFLSTEFSDPANYGAKLKRPFEVVCSAMRVCNANFTVRPDHTDSYYLSNIYLGRAGQRPFYWPTPDGYPDEPGFWQGGVLLVNVWRTLDWLIDKTNEGYMPITQITLAANLVDLPSHTPNNLATFWLNRILGYEPVGGWSGTELHTTIVGFMRQNPNSPSQWPGDALIDDISSNSNPEFWNERLRGMVKLILSSPEFMYR